MEINEINDVAYHSPLFLLKSAQHTVEYVLEMEKKNDQLNSLIMSAHCNFIVMSAACIEAHLNWYYLFDQEIDVDNYKKENNYMGTNEKITNSPLLPRTRKEVEAIFKLRNGIMHPKYQPRDATNQFQYNSLIMIFSFKTLINVCNELLEKCPDTLKGILGLDKSQIDLADYPDSFQSDFERKVGTSWVDAIENKKIGLPMINVFHVPQ